MMRYERSSSDRAPLDSRWTDWERISPHVALAVIAAEDQRFLDHGGFDLDSLRDAWQKAQRGGALRGASTISQQVSKNLFLWPGRSFVRKGLEAYLTVALELLWSKRRILEVYLNIAEFGEGVFGIGAASERFFAKVPAAITEAEAALLAAVLPNPSTLLVGRPSAYVRERQSWIRGQMTRLRANGLLWKLDRQPTGVTTGC
jgi:monofunctional biosynthetic peptidoglycan transglycosylase